MKIKIFFVTSILGSGLLIGCGKTNLQQSNMRRSISKLVNRFHRLPKLQKHQRYNLSSVNNCSKFLNFKPMYIFGGLSAMAGCCYYGYNEFKYNRNIPSLNEIYETELSKYSNELTEYHEILNLYYNDVIINKQKSNKYIAKLSEHHRKASEHHEKVNRYYNNVNNKLNYQPKINNEKVKNYYNNKRNKNNKIRIPSETLMFEWRFCIVKEYYDQVLKYNEELDKFHEDIKKYYKEGHEDGKERLKLYYENLKKIKDKTLRKRVNIRVFDAFA